MTPKKNRQEEQELAFEAGMARLEELVETLEEEDLDLDQSLALFEEGVRLTRRLNHKLDAAEKKLELLIKEDDQTLTAETLPFDPEGEE
jgi:exodeoxyribonuclease VII small subunit